MQLVKTWKVHFSLQDVKKQVHRRGSELSVSLHFLHPGELHTEIENLIAYHEQHLHLPQRQFSLDEARGCVGDYRLANCLIATLSAWYNWQQPGWTEALQRLHNAVPDPLPSTTVRSAPTIYEAGIASPVNLRLALFDYVNEHHHGFLDTNTRTSTLQGFAGLYGLSVPDLEYLLALDSDEEAILVRNASQPPTAQEVATLYNQWAFEAALFNASSVHFVIDCNAFAGAQFSASPMGTGIGAVIKRLCYLARRIGVYYDLAYDSTQESAGDATHEKAATASTGNAPTLHLTLYGPQEMTGLPQQYGLRLARLCRTLLDYGVSSRQKTRGMPLQAIVEAEATVHFLQRSYRFAIDAQLLQLLPPGSTAVSERGSGDTATLFDSGIEQSFAGAFQALQNSQGVDGWRLEREPEPLLLDHGIFIPDFALTRGNQRIYVEILGFWTPAYRERKIAKLQQLVGRDDLVLAIPLEARDAFASIASTFPITWYDGQLSATELLSVLRSRYDDFAERLADIDVAAVRERVRSEGLLPERTCYQVVCCYRRSELQRAAERVIGEGIAFTVGVGLYSLDWLEHLHHSFVEWIGGEGYPQGVPLENVLREMKVHWPILADCEDATLEALLSLWPEVHINHTSIFEATVEFFIGTPVVNAMPTEEANNVVDIAKKQVRERRTAYKKRTKNETSEADLWT